MAHPLYRTLLAVGLAFGLMACDQDAASSSDGEAPKIEQLSFGVVSTESTTGLREGFLPFCDDMTKALGIPVRAYFASDYAGIIEAMRFGSIQLAWMGNKSALEAVDRAEAEVFAHTTLKDGSAGYFSLIIVNVDSPYQNIDQVIADGDKLRFGNGDPNSTSGYLIPSYYLWAKRDIDPAKHFKRMINSNHESNLMAVATGQVDFATNNTMDLAKFSKNNPEMGAKVKPIWRSPRIPPDPLLWRKQLPDELKKRIKAFVLGYGKEGPDAEKQLAVLAGMAQGWGPFEDSSNAQLIPIRQLALAKKVAAIRNDDSYTDEQKQAQLAPLQAELTVLEAEAAKIPTP
jgi:phosphonate transport system substrate-binding protein